MPPWLPKTAARDVYDVPATSRPAGKSAAFGEFFQNFFIDSMGITRNEVDLAFLDRLTPNERKVAKNLIRRNLGLKYSHIIKGAGFFRDRQALPQLRAMYAAEDHLCSRLTIAGSLWKIDRDPLFVECLEEMLHCDNPWIKVAHLNQVTWLDDVRAVHMLLRLLNDEESFIQSLALSSLNCMEQRKNPFAIKKPHSVGYFLERSSGEAFLTMMVKNLVEWSNANEYGLR